MLRKKISSKHTIVGKEYRLLNDDEIIESNDETGCVSTLLSIDCHEPWLKVTHEFIGKTVKWNCEESGDVDGNERLFRRKL